MGGAFQYISLGPILGFLINVDVLTWGGAFQYRGNSSIDSLNIDQKSFFRYIENQYENEEINDKNFTESPTRGIN